MKQSHIYVIFWEKVRPVLEKKINDSIVDTQSYQFLEEEFSSLGNRVKSGYSFTLNVSNGIVTNNISGTAVARDLYYVLKKSPTITAILRYKKFEIRLDKSFKLKIQYLGNIVN